MISTKVLRLSPFLLPLAWVAASCGSSRSDLAASGADNRQVVGAAWTKPEVDFTDAKYVGSKQCASCGHEKIYTDWSQSLHNKMLQKAVPGVVQGNFNDQVLEHRGWRFRMYREGSNYFIHELLPGGTETLYRINYTLGTKRIQHYISLLANGAMRITFPTWDVLQGEWIHGSAIVRTAHNASGELIALPIQIWNKHCWNCHTSQEEEGFDIASGTFNTTFTETGINCEVCHGPGSVHVKRMERDRKDPNMVTVNAMRLAGEARMTDCLQCHARRIMVKKGFHMGENFFDYYQLKPVELAYQADGRPEVWHDRARRFANECLILWNSECFLKGGATCVSCHDAHQVNMAADPRYRNTDVLCTQCHKEYLDPKVAFAHTRHPLQSNASRCIECHMLPITGKNVKLLQNAVVRDHQINSPIPENTVKHAIPNACNNACHEDKPIEWVIEWMDRWYPNRRRSDFVEDTMALARRRQPEAVARLIQLAEDLSRSPIVRSGAIGFLGEYKGDTVAAALVKALDDRDIIVQAEAARALSEVAHPSSVEPLKRKLSDPVRIVRLNAVFALIKMQILAITDGYAEAFDKAKKEYLAFLREFPTVYETRVDLGTFHALHGNYEEALSEYRNAIKLRPEGPLAHYYVGITCARLGLLDEALAGFREVLELEPGFRNTRELMEQVKSVKKPR